MRSLLFRLDVCEYKSEARSRISAISRGVVAGGVRPKGWTGLGGSFDRLPSVVVLELRGAQVAER